MFTRILYAGGFILLVAGLLLSAISSPALAAGSLNVFGVAKTGTLVPDCGCTPSPGAKTPTAAPVANGASSLVFSSGCNCSCQAASATVCNVGSANMKTSVKWLLYYSVDGNPAVGGSQVTGGTLGPLNAGQCVNLSYQPQAAGNFAYYVEQEQGAAGPSYIWSNSCLVNGSCFAATHTPTPFVPATHTPTRLPSTFTFTPPPIEITLTPTKPVTQTPAPPATNTATRPPLPYNLSAVCGYMGEQTRQWKVANHTSAAVNYTWRSDNGETGSGTAEANQDSYFNTTLAAQQVELFVNNERVDTEQAVAACKQSLVISYNCTSTGLEWTVRNPNDFGIDFTWKLDTGESGRGTLNAGGQAMVATSSKGAHRLDVTWTDTRPGTHSVSMSSPMNSCESTITNTPTSQPATLTYTPPPVEVTLTNTVPPATLTNTPVSPTFTSTPVPPTLTFTPHPLTPTVTPSSTSPGYPPPVIITLTPTHTNTPVPPPTNTPVTPPTNTPVTPPTNTPMTPATNTPVSQPSSAPPVIITVLVTNTPAPTATGVPVNTATSAPPVIITVVVTNTPAPTNTTAPTNTRTPAAQQIPGTGGYPAPATNTPVPTATSLVTLAPPVAQATQTPILIPVTGVDLTRPVGANGLSILGSLFTNLGLFTLGLALALTGYTRFTRRP